MILHKSPWRFSRMLRGRGDNRSQWLSKLRITTHSGNKPPFRQGATLPGNVAEQLYSGTFPLTKGNKFLCGQFWSQWETFSDLPIRMLATDHVTDLELQRLFFAVSMSLAIDLLFSDWLLQTVGCLDYLPCVLPGCLLPAAKKVALCITFIPQLDPADCKVLILFICCQKTFSRMGVSK